MGKRYTIEDDAAIREGRAALKSAAEIARSINRTRDQVRGRIIALGLPPLPADAIAKLQHAARKAANAKRSDDARERSDATRWTADANALLAELWFKPISIAEIAARVGHTWGAVTSHAHRTLMLGNRPRHILQRVHRRVRLANSGAPARTHSASRSSGAEHSWSIVGRKRICVVCGAAQFASYEMHGALPARVWVCDVPATCESVAA